MGNKKNTQKVINTINKHLKKGDILLKYRLRLLVDEWGSYKKGDEDNFYIRMKDEGNGVSRFAIDERWEIVSVEIDSFTK